MKGYQHLRHFIFYNNMSDFRIRTALPTRILENLRSNGARFREECEIKIIEVLESQTISMFDDFLKSDKAVDPVLTPYFGHPNAVYVPMNIQLEVYRLLQTYQALMAENYDFSSLFILEYCNNFSSTRDI